MGRTKRDKRRSPSFPESPSTRIRYIVAWAAGVAIGAAGLVGIQEALQSDAAQTGTSPGKPAVQASTPRSHYDLLAKSPDELAQADIALMNLLCAKGLPRAEDLDIPTTLATLDQWAAKVKSETERHLYRVTDPRYAEHYNHSEARLRVEFIVQVLQEDCGVRYNPDRIYEPDFRDARDLFIHGMLPGNAGGTCASMPVLYVAIGRRLGYPMKLVQAREHLFCRWDGPNERFNIEGAGNGGVDYYPDEHYRTWPRPLSDAAMASGVYLSSLTPEQELWTFLHDRGTCLHANGRMPKARAAFAEAHRLEPRSANTHRALVVVSGGRAGGRSAPNPAAEAWLRRMSPPDLQPGRPQQPWNPPMPGPTGSPPGNPRPGPGGG